MMLHTRSVAGLDFAMKASLAVSDRCQLRILPRPQQHH
jgi:hypothetical protein